MECMILGKVGDDSSHRLKSMKLLYTVYTYKTNNQHKPINFPHLKYPTYATVFTHRNVVLFKGDLNKYVCSRLIGKQVGIICCKLVSSSLYAKNLKHFFPKINIQDDPQLNLWNGFVIGMIRSMDSSLSLLQIYHSLKHCTCYRMSTSTNVVATTRKLFEQKNDNIDTMLNGQKQQVSVWWCLVKKRQRAKKLCPSAPSFGLDTTH